MTEETIFAEAAALKTNQERAAYLRKVCGGQPDLLRRVVGLLKMHEATGDFLKPVARTTTLGDPQAPASGPSRPRPPRHLAEAAGTLIGRYKLLQQIGEGGFGTVWMAEQREPVKRKVALKIIKLGMDTKQVIARFEAERQALAMMEHPNIARVLDAGSTDAGRPYFVMELVKGVPITEYCDSNNLTTQQRLELFIKVCHAIQHAHQKGIIHRDIKPSNVLVTLHDGTAVPKVIDFGIAKATNAELTEKTLFTEHRQMIGTPAYMSPEQAEMSGLDIDTRSDIYSLGVLLYELLTGTPPFSAKDLLHAGLGEMQRIIREQEPARPSQRVSTLGNEQLTVVAKHRSIDPSKLTRDIRGDLDWIVMKALEKDRGRRFDTANAFASDIQRHLANEPVTARPAGKLYAFRKFVRRNKAGAAAAIAIAFTLLLGIAGTTAGMFRAVAAQATSETSKKEAIDQRNIAVGLLDDVKRAKSDAEEQARKAQAAKVEAEKQTQRAKAANAFMRDMITSAQPATRPTDGSISTKSATDMKVSDVLRYAAVSLDRLKDQPELELDARLNLAKTFELLNDMGSALTHYERALVLSKQIAGDLSEQTLQITVDVMLTRLNAVPDQVPEEPARFVAKRVRDQLGLSHPLTFEADNNIALSLRARGRLKEAEAVLRELVERVDSTPNVIHPKGTARYIANLAKVVGEQGRLGEAEKLQRDGLARAATENQTDARRSLLYRAQLADSLIAQGKLEEAVSVLEQATEYAKTQVDANNYQASRLVQVLFTLRAMLGRYEQCAEGIRQFLKSQLNLTESYRLILEFAAAEADLRAGKGEPAIQQIRSIALTTVAIANARGDSDPEGMAGHAKYNWIIGQMLADMRSDLAWNGKGNKRFFEHLIWNEMHRRADGGVSWPLDFSGMRGQVRRWNGIGVPATQPLVDASLSDWRNQPDLAPGVYIASAQVPRPGTFPLEAARWVLIGPWQVDLFRLPNTLYSDDQTIENAFKGTPSERRLEPSLNYVNITRLDEGYGPKGESGSFALSSTTTVTVPPGTYRFGLHHEGSARAWIDGELVYDGWQSAKQLKPLIAFSDKPHQIRVQVAKKLGYIDFFLEPQDAATTKLFESCNGGWVYNARLQIESINLSLRKDEDKVTLRRRRMNQYCRLGQFAEAEAELAWLNSVDPQPLEAYRRACLLAYLGKRTELGQVCEWMFKKYADHKDMTVIERLAMAGMVLPASQGGWKDLPGLAPMVDGPLATGGRSMNWFQLAKGIHEFRLGQGRYSSAIGWFDKSTPALTGYGKVTSQLYAAMAYRDTGETTKARESWNAAQKYLSESDLHPGKDDLVVAGFENWLITHIVLREAKPLFEK